MQGEPSPIACRMDALTGAERSRRAELLALVRAHVREIRETDDGIAIRIEGERSLLAAVAEFVSLESRCCPFIRFQIELEAEAGPICLRLGGRAGVKSFLTQAFLG